MKYYTGRKDLLIQFIKFNIIGIINTVITYLLFSFLFFLTGNYALSLTADYVFGIIFSLFINNNISLNVSEMADYKMFSKMILSYFIVFIINLFILMLLIEILHMNGYLSQIIAQVFIMLAGFIAQKLYVFSHHPAGSPK
jgi:putative flippase GtrA